MFKRKQNKKILYWSEAPSLTIDAKERWAAWCEYPAIKSADIITGLPTNHEPKNLPTFKKRKDAFEAMPEIGDGVRQSSRGWLFTFRDFIRAYKHPTIKKCPSIVALLSRCILVKAPCDFVVTKDGDFFAAEPELVSIGSHHPDQSHTRKATTDWWHFKLLAIGFSPQFKTSIISFDAMYHTMNPWRVMMGSDVGTYAESDTITVNVLVPDHIQEVQFNRGDPICYYYINEPNLTFEETKTERKTLRHLDFWRSVGTQKEHDMEFFTALYIEYTVRGIDIETYLILPTYEACQIAIRDNEHMQEYFNAESDVNMWCIQTIRLSHSIRPKLRPEE